MVIIRYFLQKFCLLISIFLIFSLQNIINAIASESIIITHGSMQKIPIAINLFDYNSNKERDLGNKIISVINNDLRVSGIFHPISSAAFLENKYGLHYVPFFAAWRQLNANLLVNGKIKYTNDNKMTASFVIWDVLSESEIAREAFTLSANLWRKAAHKISDRIYEHVTGDPGYFDSKIVYISETPSNKKTRIAIMDHDGANHYFITNGQNQVLTPSFSPQGDQITYVAYHNKIPMVHLRHIHTGKDMLIGKFNGINFSPCFSPDGNKVLMSISQFRSPATHIYEVNLTTKQIRPLTTGNSINTSPSYSPDGTKITFTSDKNGAPQIYIMNRDGSCPERISSGYGTYTTPVWSPGGEYIAFTRSAAGEGFGIGVMKVDGTDERIIAQGYLVEGPSWAPNGKTIIFARTFPGGYKKGEIVELYAIDYTGYNERKIPTPHNGCDPSWSLTQSFLRK